MAEAPDQSDQIAQRRAKLAELREHGNPFPNDFRRDALAARLHARFGNADNPSLESEGLRVKVGVARA